MKITGNVLWIIMGGLVISIAWSIAGLLMCVTIIGIPFALQHFKLAKLALIPFGAQIRKI